MISLNYAKLAEVVGGQLLNNNMAKVSFHGASIDSRVVTSGQLFIAIKGEKMDGHNFIKQAVASGASGIMVEPGYPSVEHLSDNTAVIKIKNTHRAMMKLAAYYRSEVDAKFVAITGSNGKTTTKELAYRLIKVIEKKTFCSPGNFNNLFGVPLALFSIDNDAKVVVMELGISTKNEMPKLAEIVNPDLILFTNVGPSHLEFLDSVKDVARAKLALLENSAPSSKALVNADDATLLEEARKIREDIITFGMDESDDFTIDALQTKSDGTSLIQIDGYKFQLPLIGRHQAYNLLAAYAIFKTLGYSFENIDTESIELDTAPMRGQFNSKGGINFIVDCYNANPDSVKAGLVSFFEYASDSRRIIILGDMLELGEAAVEYHKEIGMLLSRYEFDMLITVGEMSRYISENIKNSVHYNNANDAALDISNIIRQGDFVYMKASRGISLEKVYQVFEKQEETA